jgi:hypothetical protein
MFKDILKRQIHNFKTDERNCGDLVQCCNCESIMLVNYNIENCPICQGKGCLTWIDDLVLVNLIDEYAKNQVKPTEMVLKKMTSLANKADITLAEFCEANDVVPTVNTWNEVVKDFTEKFKNGDRVSIKKE